MTDSLKEMGEGIVKGLAELKPTESWFSKYGPAIPSGLMILGVLGALFQYFNYDKKRQKNDLKYAKHQIEIAKHTKVTASHQKQISKISVTMQKLLVQKTKLDMKLGRVDLDRKEQELRVRKDARIQVSHKLQIKRKGESPSMKLSRKSRGGAERRSTFVVKYSLNIRNASNVNMRVTRNRLVFYLGALDVSRNKIDKVQVVNQPPSEGIVKWKPNKQLEVNVDKKGKRTGSKEFKGVIGEVKLGMNISGEVELMLKTTETNLIGVLVFVDAETNDGKSNRATLWVYKTLGGEK